ncbi:MAG: pantetheine-phosphate adenylyltransferase [Armatimonadetes bacterium]|nr:pantetheine-phosphate adenylyltransferase [Armatimonadota bacterium]
MIALVPGTFDPITLGHVDVVERAAGLFDEVVLAVLANPGKAPWFSAEERTGLAAAALAHLSNVRVDRFDGLLVQLAGTIGARAVVKGLRSGADYEYERAMALMNRELSPLVETVFVVGDARLAHVSSSLVREVAWFGGEIDSVVPPVVAEALCRRVAERRAGAS